MTPAMTIRNARAARQALARTLAAELAAAGTTSDRDIDARTYRLTNTELVEIGYESDRDLLALQHAVRALLTPAGPQACLDDEPRTPLGRRAPAALLGVHLNHDERT